MTFSSKTASKIAFREARASAGKFAFVVAAVAVGVAALTGVRGFSLSFQELLLREARSLMAADISVRRFGNVDEAAQSTRETLERLAKRGVRHTRVNDTLSMVSSAKSEDPVLVTLKAIEPRVFPFYGVVTLEPNGRLSERLKADTVVISDDLRLRLGTGVGERLRIGNAEFQVAGLILAEPDRISGSFNVGPRILISFEGLERAGLMQLGSRGSSRLLFQLGPQAPGVAEVQAELKRAFPDAFIVDYREINPRIAQGLDRATTFLSLVSLIALVVGAIGVGSAMHAHLQQRMDTIAVMKSIGARSNQIILIYVLQTLLLGLAGGLLGVVGGLGVQWVFPVFIAKYFQVSEQISWQPVAAAQGLGVGLLITLLFTLPPLLSIREIRPGLILRRDMAEVKPTWRKRFRRSRASIAVGLAILVGIGGIAAWLSGGAATNSPRLAATFAGGLLLSAVALSGFASLLLRLLRLLISRSPVRIGAVTRHGIANLYRPGSQARAVLTSLGIGVMFTLTIYLVQHSMLAEIQRSAPPSMSNVFFLDVTQQQKDELLKILRDRLRNGPPPELIANVSARIAAVDGEPVSQMELTGRAARMYRSNRPMTSTGDKPDSMQLTSGEWWKGTPAEAQVSVSAGAARAMNLKPGSVIDWTAAGRSFRTRVAAIHRMRGERLLGMVEFIASPGVLEGFPTIYYGGARVPAAQIGELQRTVYRKFPTITVVNIADIIDRVQEVVDQVSVVVRFISLFAIAAGAIILGSSVAGTRFRRVREVAILKTLGATRGRIGRMFSAEFLILGATAGLMGSLLATLFSWLLLSRFFDAPYRFDIVPAAIAVAGTALVAAGAGWAASFRILSQKPLEILRGE